MSSTRPRPWLPPKSAAFSGFRFPPQVIVVAVKYLRYNPSIGRRTELARPPPSAIAVASGVEEADEGVDVLGFPCLPEVPDDLGQNLGRMPCLGLMATHRRIADCVLEATACRRCPHHDPSPVGSTTAS
jgi:hypothetical protein